jgi:uncharacterized protein YjbI with pentapeptide repeats
MYKKIIYILNYLKKQLEKLNKLLVFYSNKKMLATVNAFFIKWKLQRAVVSRTINLNTLQFVDLSYMNLSYIDIRGAKLNNAILERTKFKHTILQGAVLSKAKLLYANLQGSNLSYADFTGADLRGVNMKNVILYKTNFTGADLRGADLTDARIDATTNFMEANMINIIVDENKLNKAITAGAIIKPLRYYDRMLYSIGYRKKFFKDAVSNMKQIVPVTK